MKNSNINSYQFINDNNLITTQNIENSNFSLDIDLKKLYKNEHIDKEVLNLLNSLGTKWYKCPNNHLYTVGNCGRPMEESRCPQCKVKIGGLNHVPASGNLEVNLNTEIINNNKNTNINHNQNNNQNRINNQNQNNDQNRYQRYYQDDSKNNDNYDKNKGDCNIV